MRTPQPTTALRFVAGAAGLMAAVACASDRDAARAFTGDDLVGAAELRCDGSDLVELPPTGQALAGGVVLAGSYTADGTPRENGLLFAKGGLWVRGSTAVRLTVDAPLDTLVAWGKPGGPARQVVVPPCQGPEWRVWPGGFLVSGPATVSLLVETKHERATVTVTVNAPATTNS